MPATTMSRAASASPASNFATLPSARRTSAICESSVTPATCGASTTFLNWNSGLSGDHGRRFHQAELATADDFLCLTVQRKVEGNDVRGPQEVVKRQVRNAELRFVAGSKPSRVVIDGHGAEGLD